MLLHISVNDHVVEEIIPYQVKNFSKVAIDSRTDQK